MGRRNRRRLEGFRGDGSGPIVRNGWEGFCNTPKGYYSVVNQINREDNLSFTAFPQRERVTTRVRESSYDPYIVHDL